ncbi:MAG: hypothetical protein LUG18_16295 [Candidatus Azobacteroides sp.]|nr:hypothetical protein [Candidatus Azobacteroides sp.]
MRFAYEKITGMELYGNFKIFLPGGFATFDPPTLPFMEGKYLLATPKGEGFTHS